MKLSSPRTWLIVAAGVLLLAGVGVVYVLKYLDPPLPRGWTLFDCERYRVALPAGEGTEKKSFSVWFWYCHRSPGGVEVLIDSEHSSWRSEYGEDEFEWHGKGKAGVDQVVVTRRERINSHGNPALALLLTVKNRHGESKIQKRFVILAKSWRHQITVDLVPGVLTEADADFLFRSFRPK